MLPDKLDKYVDASVALCRNYGFTKEYGKALEILTKAENCFRRVISQIRWGKFCVPEAVSYTDKNNMQKQQQTTNRLQTFQNSSGSDVKYQDALSSLNRCHTMMGNETAARQTEQDAERQRMAVLNRLLKENLEQLDAYRLQWGEDGLMYVSALGTIADIYYTQGQTDKALAYMEPFSPAKQPRCVIFSVSRKPMNAWHSGRISVPHWTVFPSVQPISPQQVHLNKNNVLPG